MRKNMFLIAGYGVDETPYIRAAVRETGKEHPVVSYIGTANGENRLFLESHFIPMMKEAGAASVTLVPLLGKKHGTEKTRKLLTESDLIYIAGGEVEDGMIGIPSDIRVLLRQLFDLGKVILTMSAGTIMCGIGWPHWDDEDNHPEDAILFDCLGFASTIFDTHCEDEDWVELRKAVELSPEGFVGYGIPAGGCVVVSPDGVMHPSIPLDAFRSENRKAVYDGKYRG